MQTFLPYPDVMKSLTCLDNSRLGQQRREAKQILKSLLFCDPSGFEEVHPDAEERLGEPGWRLGREGPTTYTGTGWRSHPARVMWVGHPGALAIYHDCAIVAWKLRGCENNMPFLSSPGKHKLPAWFGDEEFHASHRSNLLRKEPHFYGPLGWTEPSNLEYVWPSREERFRA